MNREIKFRAWDKDNKCWYHSPQLVIRPYSGKVNDGATTPNIELMQCTGLKDKNGKEIYEGDIVFAEARFDCANMVVVWDKGSFVLVPCEKYKNYISGCGYKDIRWLTKTVIGNIYENKNLLEVTNE